MQRTIISISDADNAWLNQQAKLQHLAKTELIRRAIVLYKETEMASQQAEDLTQALALTKGLLNGQDGLKRQQSLRDEWEK